MAYWNRESKNTYGMIHDRSVRMGRISHPWYMICQREWKEHLSLDTWYVNENEKNISAMIHDMSMRMGRISQPWYIISENEKNIWAMWRRRKASQTGLCPCYIDTMSMQYQQRTLLCLQVFSVYGVSPIFDRPTGTQWVMLLISCWADMRTKVLLISCWADMITKISC